MLRHEINKQLLEKFTLEQLHDICRFYKRLMNPLDYRSRVTLGESDSNIIKKRFIPYMAGFFDQSEIKEYAKLHQIKLD